MLHVYDLKYSCVCVQNDTTKRTSWLIAIKNSLCVHEEHDCGAGFARTDNDE